MCRGSQCWQQQQQWSSAADQAAQVLRAAAAAVRQPMKSLLPRPLATSSRMNLNLVWDAMEGMMGADDPIHSAVADNLHNEWLEGQMDGQASTQSHKLLSESRR